MKSPYFASRPDRRCPILGYLRRNTAMAGHAPGKNLFSFQDVGNGGVRPGNDILQIDPVPACLVEYMQIFDQIKAHSTAPRTLHSPMEVTSSP